MQDGRFSKLSHFWHVRFFFEGFLPQNNSNVLVEWLNVFRILQRLFCKGYFAKPFCKGYSLCMHYILCKMADLENFLNSRIYGVFASGFLHRQLLCSCGIVFRMFLGFLIFDPNWPLCKGYSLCLCYSLCKVVDFQNCLISRIFGVFWAVFWTDNSYVLVELFFDVFGIFNFWFKLTTFQRL